MFTNTAPRVSVVVVSDFEPGEKTWRDEIAMATMLARQNVDAPFPLIIVENSEHRGEPLPQELVEAFPGVRVVYHESERSADLKDYGVSLCTTEWVAVLEADAAPEPDWLKSLLDAAATNPGYDVFTGRTYYGAESSWKRTLNLLDRSFDDHGHSRATLHISNNAALYRTEMLRRFPYPEADSPFLSSRMRNYLIFQAGHRAYFERKALSRHAIGGLDFVMDYRKHTGFADMLRGGTPSIGQIPVRLAQRIREELGCIMRVHRDYLRWYDWPLVLALFCFARIPEAVGMITAVRGRGFARTAYR